MNAAQTLGFVRQMEVEMSKEGAITPEMIGALTGAGLGGLAGYAGTDDPRKKWRNTLLAGLGGGALGGIVGGAAGGETGPTTAQELAEQAKSLNWRRKMHDMVLRLRAAEAAKTVATAPPIAY